ncbi:NAD(+) diphosphatase [Motilibacter deserti]|uniref:NAD(+) diphosphatase n=1 Tax=Motilibacter deserti TaxID=2714956 RepID=A0ABX0GQZ0_9ACTN|nr:NAD(+) diphosphatase [Motilibacter deserti]NHC13271.1 NAD(+) diphosphatase [Motilibacter deserti]
MTLGDLALSRASVDRAAWVRTDDAELERLWSDSRTRVLRLREEGLFPVVGDPPALALEAPSDEDCAGRIFLGLDDAGVGYFATLPRPGRVDPDEDGLRVASLRDVGSLLSARDVGLAVNAVALGHWHARHTHCPRCGAATEIVKGGHVRRCTADGSEHYPRTDPAVIMAITDADDRLLLGRQPRWPEKRFSTLAGFVEPGESIEAAVRREVLEEVGVVVGDVTYLGSQAWPFPASLMLGFTGRATTTELRVDGDEIAQAVWVSRSELAAATASGEILLPPGVSIARRLIEHWYGGELAPDGTWR